MVEAAVEQERNLMGESQRDISESTAQVDSEFWNKIAEGYAKKPLANAEATRRKLEIIRSQLSSEDVVLDLGCGTGTIALELAPHVRKVISVDVSSEMIRIAREKTEKQGVTNIEYRCLGVTEALAAIESESVNAVLTFNILHLIEDWRVATREIHRVLKPDGFFATSTVCLRDSWIPFRPVITMMRWMGKAPYVAFLRRKELVANLLDTGFAEVQNHEVGAGKTSPFLTALKSV